MVHAPSYLYPSLPMRGAWIEIASLRHLVGVDSDCRSPCGERGLKSAQYVWYPHQDWSLPMRGAWIEIASTDYLVPQTSAPSLPMRGAWIEIVMKICRILSTFVAPHAGSVD